MFDTGDVLDTDDVLDTEVGCAADAVIEQLTSVDDGAVDDVARGSTARARESVGEAEVPPSVTLKAPATRSASPVNGTGPDNVTGPENVRFVSANDELGLLTQLTPIGLFASSALFKPLARTSEPDQAPVKMMPVGRSVVSGAVASLPQLMKTPAHAASKRSAGRVIDTLIPYPNELGS